MQSNWTPPHSLRDLFWTGLAIILLTLWKRISNGIAGFWRNFRLSPAEADRIHAEAQKLRAEADSITTHDAMGVAQMMREVATTMAEANALQIRLKEKLASQESQINLLKIENSELKERNTELEESEQKKA